MNKKVIFKGLLVLTLITSYAVAGYNKDIQSWNNVTLTANPNNKNITYSLETQLRFGNDISKLSQEIVRPSLIFKVDSKQSAALGYAWIDTRSPFTIRSIDEHRIWEQYLFAKELDFAKLTSRTRLEQRFIQRMSKTGWRFREMLKLEKPLINTNYYLIVMDELFLQMNKTSRVANNQGFEQNRFMIGFGININRKGNLELGVQNQILRRVGVKDFVSNAFIMNINYPIW